MKKAKMLLTGIAVLAVVGGALAFKANSAFTTSYCTVGTSDWSTNGNKCPNSDAGLFDNQSSGAIGQFYYVAGSGCNSSTGCSVSGFLHTN